MRLLVSVGLLSASVIGFELVLMQFFSITQWYHFAFMVLSVALLGFGIAGMILSLFRVTILRNWSAWVPALAVVCGIAMVVLIPISQTSAFRFDSYRIFLEWEHLVSLALTYGLLSVPYFCAALATGIVLLTRVNRIGLVYAVTMASSAFGSLCAIGLMWYLHAQQIAVLFGVMCSAAGLIASTRRTSFLVGVSFLTLVLGALVLLHRPSRTGSEYKGLNRALAVSGARIIGEQPSPFGHVQVVSSPGLRSAPGLSLASKGTLPAVDGVFSNGDWFGPLETLTNTGGAGYLDSTTLALPYVMRNRKKVLLLGAGTGAGIMQSIRNGASEILAVEPHEGVLKELRERAGPRSAFDHQRVSVLLTQPRTLLETDTTRVDLIVLPLMETFGGSGGVHALQEQWSFTAEAVGLMFDRLNYEGVICVSAWVDYPARTTLRILSTLVEALALKGIDNPIDHIAAVRSWGTVTFCLKKNPLKPEETESIRRFCRSMFFDPLMLPDLAPGERMVYNKLSDESFFQMVDALLGLERLKTAGEYDFRITPTTDDRPYFFQFVRFGTLLHLAEIFGTTAVPFIELGYLIILLTGVQIIPASLLIVFIPMRRLRLRGPGLMRTLVFFGSIGIGFMLVEMMLIHRFSFYFDHQIYSAAVVLGGMLMLSGIGSASSRRMAPTPRRLAVILSILSVLIVLSSLSLTTIMRETIGWPGIARVFLACVFMAPLAFAMGVPFPSGLRFLSNSWPDRIAWAWGINGCLSVIGTVMATVLLMEWGFTAVMVAAAGMYTAAALSLVKWTENQTHEE